MTYLESAEGITITKSRAFKEFKDHGASHADFEEFLMDVIADPDTTLDDEGNVETLPAQSVLFWLGY